MLWLLASDETPDSIEFLLVTNLFWKMDKSLMALSVSFFVFSVIGVSAIVLDAFFGDGKIGIVFAATGLAVYFFIVIRKYNYLKNPSEEIPNSIYYLGFVYTLVALLSSFYLLDTDQQNSSMLLTNFAISIVTTVLGLFLRQVVRLRGVEVDSDEFDYSFIYMKVESTAKEAMEQIVGTSEIVLKELFVNADFNALREKIEISATDLLEKVSKFEKEFTQFENTLTKSLEAAFAERSNQIAQLTNHIDQLAVASAENAEALMDKHKRLSDSLATSISMINHSENQLVQRKLIDSIDASCGALQLFTNEIVQKTTNIAASLEQCSSQVENTEGVMKHLSDGMKALSKQSEQLSLHLHDVESVSKEIGALANQNLIYYENIENDKLFIEEYRLQMKNNMDESVKALGKTVRVLSNSLEEIKKVFS